MVFVVIVTGGRRTWLALALVVVGLGIAPLAHAAAVHASAANVVAPFDDDPDNDFFTCVVAPVVAPRVDTVAAVAVGSSQPSTIACDADIIAHAPKTSPPR